MKNKYIALLSSTALIFFAAEASAQSAPPAIYVTPARTLTNGQTTPLFTDVNGNLKITGTLTGFSSTPTFNCGTGCYQTTQPVSQGAGAVASGAYLSGSFADGAIATLGTQADTAWTSGNGTGIAILKSAATSLSQIAAGTAASSTLPIYGQATTSAPSYTTNTANPLSLDTSGNLRVNVVTGGTSGTVAQGSTTSGQSGMLIQGAVTTSPPSYTTAQTSPLSLDTAGNLRVNVVTGGGGGGAVYGPTAVGSAAANPPVLAAGTANATATGTVQVEKVDSSGNQYVVLSTGANAIGSITNTSFTATQATASSLNATVVGTGTFATQVTSLPALVAGTANIGVVGQAQGSTTSGQNGQLIQGAVTTANPSYTTAQTSPLSLTTSGGLRHDLTSYAGTALTGTVTAYGTAPTGNVFGVNSYITNTPAVSQSGTWNIGSITTLPPLVAGSAVIGVVGNSQASTTSGQSGPLIQGAVTTATPTYTTAQTNPLSLDTNGGLRVQPAGVTPAASTASTITTGGTAVTAVTGPVRGCYITNPTSATDEGIGTAENLYVNPVTTATTTGNGTTLTLVPGQSFFCIPGQTTSVSAVAATSSHKFTAVVW